MMECFEQLERRVLLSGDHPSLADFPDSTLISLTQGSGSEFGDISEEGMDHLFRFEAPSDDFVRVLADAFNEGSDLDTRVAVFVEDPDNPGQPAALLNADGNPVMASNSGFLTGGTPPDAWVGFVAEAGQTYYIQVLSVDDTGPGATGEYTIRIEAESEELVPDTNGEVNVTADLTRPLEDIVYRVDTGSSLAFDSVVTLTALADPAELDTRLDVYDSEGRRIAFNSQAGRQSNAFLTFKGNPDDTFYIRVRSDEYLPGEPRTGTFTLAGEFQATEVELDPVSRVHTSGRGVGPAQTELMRFTAQASGTAVIQSDGDPMAGTQPTTRLFDSSGELIGFSSSFAGLSSRIQMRLTGGEEYFIVVDHFVGGVGPYGLLIIANLTSEPDAGVDDHPSIINDGEDIARRFATPIIWNDPETIIPGERDPVITGFGNGYINQPGDTDVFVFIPPIDMLSDFEGVENEDGDAWLSPDFRPMGRLQVVVEPTQGAFINSQIRVLDSNFEEIYSNTQIDLMDPSPSGAIDPSRFPPDAFDPPPFLEPWRGPKVWGGVPYYIEVSSVTAGIGPYAMSVSVDAVPPDEISTYQTPPNGGDFNNALPIGLPDGTGAGTNARNIDLLAMGNPLLFRDIMDRFWEDPDPSEDEIVSYTPHWITTQFSRIHTIDDSDIYFFRAPETGTAEIRVQTTDLEMEHWEFLLDESPTFADPPEDPVPIVGTEENGVFFGEFTTDTLSSNLHSAIRVFNNDRIQIGYAVGDPAVQGTQAEYSMGPLGDFTFNKRDGRLVIPVERGEVYFVQIESGQLYADGRAQEPVDRVLNEASEIDWRHATGHYQLLINSTPVGGADFVTVPILEDGTSDLMLRFSELDGEYTDSLTTGTPERFYRIVPPSSGVARIDVGATPLSGLIPRVIAFDDDGNIVADATAPSGGTAVVEVLANQGEVLNFAVVSSGGTTGRYTVDVSGLEPTDPLHTHPIYGRAEEIRLLDFLGGAVVDGEIRNAGEFNLYKINPSDFAEMTIRLEASGAFNGAIQVLEISEDLADNPVQLWIGSNDGQDLDNPRNAQLTVGLTGSRISSFSGNEYPYYYIIVEGANREVDRGSYTLHLEYDPLDDHPTIDELLDPSLRDLATQIVIDPSTGLGEAEGILERVGNTDLFQFVVPAGGRLSVNVNREGESEVLPRVTLYDSDINVIDSDAATSPGGLPASIEDILVERGQVYFLIVEGYEGGSGDEQVGGYNVRVNAPAIDDHANEGEWDLATFIPIDPTTGIGRIGTDDFGDPDNALIDPTGDTDLFRFEPLADGEVVVEVVSLNPGAGSLRPQLTIFRGEDNQYDEVSSTMIGDTVSITIPDAQQGETFFALVQDTFGLGGPLSEYTIIVNAEPGDPPPSADPSIVDFNNPRQVQLDQRGDGQRSGQIEVPNRRQLFTFNAFNSGEAFVQVVTATGSQLDGRMRVLSAPNEDPESIVLQDSNGVPGATANGRFQVEAGQQYWVIVGGVGNSTGSYTLRVDSPPAPTEFPDLPYEFVYPEGFASESNSEFLAIANPNDFDVTYTVVLRYEEGDRDAIVQNNVTIAAGTRGGMVLTDGSEVADGVRLDTPYAIVVYADGPIAAAVSRYDFGASTGDTLTDRPSDRWAFSRVERRAGEVADFIVFYNPNDFDTTVTLTARTASGTVTLERTVEAFRRGGFAIGQESELPSGIFGVSVRAEAADPSNQPAFRGIVASLSHFDISDQRGFAAIGDATLGSRAGAIPSLQRGGGVQSQLTIYNPTNNPATVDLRGQYILPGLPQVERRVELAPGQSKVLTGQNLGLVPGQAVGIDYTSNRNVAVLAMQTQFGEINAIHANTRAAQTWFIGDAFIGKQQAGERYFETLSFYNPGPTSNNISIELLYANGESDSFAITVSNRGFARINLHELDLFLGSPVSTNLFSIKMDAPSPFSISFTHYDLFFGGGWGTSGSPLGLLNPISTIIS